jgi:hypothetical protein
MTDASLMLSIPYLVTGGVASVVYGEPRLTRDIDLVIGLRPRDARRFAAAWSAEEFYVPPVEVIEEESGRPAHGHFNVIHNLTAMRADIYLPGDDALSAWAFAHKVVRRIEDDEVFMAPIEAVILGKSDRHLRDIHRMLRVSGDLVDRPELEHWAARLGVEGEWTQAQEFQEL